MAARNEDAAFDQAVTRGRRAATLWRLKLAALGCLGVLAVAIPLWLLLPLGEPRTTSLASFPEGAWAPQPGRVVVVQVAIDTRLVPLG